jgi:hypothetical protein
MRAIVQKLNRSIIKKSGTANNASFYVVEINS